MNKHILKAFLCLLILNIGVGSAQETKKVKIDVFTLEVPSELKALTQEERELKYAPQGQVPDVVYQDENDDVNVSFKKTAVPLKEEQFSIFRENLEKHFSQHNMEILESKILYLDTKKFVLTKVILKTDNILMTNLVTSDAGKMVMLIISHSKERKNYGKENDMIMKSLKVSKL